jgi:hypothetical protein
MWICRAVHRLTINEFFDSQPSRAERAGCHALLFGGYRFIRHGHPKGGGMRVGFRDLTLWSFLTASAHGAGLMVLPVLFGLSAGEHAGHSAGTQSLSSASLAVGIHTAGYLVVTALVAAIIYEKVGLAVLRKAWVTMDPVWAGALVLTGLLILMI